MKNVFQVTDIYAYNMYILNAKSYLYREELNLLTGIAELNWTSKYLAFSLRLLSS